MIIGALIINVCRFFPLSGNNFFIVFANNKYFNKRMAACLCSCNRLPGPVYVLVIPDSHIINITGCLMIMSCSVLLFSYFRNLSPTPQCPKHKSWATQSCSSRAAATSTSRVSHCRPPDPRPKSTGTRTAAR